MSDSLPSPLESHLGYWLRRVSNRVSHGFANALAARDVSVAEWVALRHLCDHPRLSPSALANTTGMTQGAVSKVADKLLAKGWIVTFESEIDRRGRFLALSDAGRKVLPELAAIADENDERYFGPLSAEERCALRRLLERLSEIHEWNDIPVT